VSLQFWTSRSVSTSNGVDTADAGTVADGVGEFEDVRILRLHDVEDEPSYRWRHTPILAGDGLSAGDDGNRAYGTCALFADVQRTIPAVRASRHQTSSNSMLCFALGVPLGQSDSPPV